MIMLYMSLRVTQQFHVSMVRRLAMLGLEVWRLMMSLGYFNSNLNAAMRRININTLIYIFLFWFDLIYYNSVCF